MAARDAQQEERPGGGGGRGDAEPEERTDGWMTTYADMVTLLMTFFVLMFAISNVDNQKAALFFAGMRPEGISAEDFLEILQDVGPGDNPDNEWFPEPKPSGEDSADGEDSAAGEDGLSFGNPELELLFNLIDDYIGINGLGDRISLQFNGEFLMLTLANDIWFESGRAQITAEMQESAAVLARLLAQTFNADKPFEIVVAGHTDNRPINTPQYPSNWHVSKDRAVNFLEALIAESELDPFYFYARACGEERPIADNSTPEGRQRNRRVEVMISLAREDPVWWEDFSKAHAGLLPAPAVG